MPSSNVKNRCFEEMFKGNVQYIIPFFQRGYVWETKQWKQLFEDINEKILEHLEDESSYDNVEHFFGPVVVSEQTNDDPQLKSFLVIDGQQRITTAYMLLITIRNLLSKKISDNYDAAQYVRQLDKLIINSISSDSEDYSRIKVKSVKGDRYATYLAVFNQNPNDQALAIDQANYIPGSSKINKIQKYFEKSRYFGQKSVDTLWNYAQAILKGLKVVWIPLDPNKDDPQAIFESLNDKGTPLSASELLCNYIFKPLYDANIEIETLHNDIWLKVQQKIERENLSFEEYLRHLYSMDNKKMLGKGRQIYSHFKYTRSGFNAGKAKAELERIAHFSEIYLNIANPEALQHEDIDVYRYLSKLHRTGITQIYPFVMQLLDSFESNNLSKEDLINLLHKTYVLIVRRKISDETRQFNTVFPSLYKELHYEVDKTAKFMKIITESGLYVSDVVFEDSLKKKKLYVATEKPFVLMLLQELDKSMNKYDELPDYDKFNTIEHIMPQTLTNEWRAEIDDDIKHSEFETYRNGLGNLTINSQKANSLYSNKSFKEKCSIYTGNTALTRDILDRWQMTPNMKWNIDAIKARTADLAETAIALWSWNSLD